MGRTHWAPSGSQPWSRWPALRVLRAGLDRGLAGPGDVAGAAAGLGRRPGSRARAHQGRVLRHRLQPDAGMGAPPAGSGPDRHAGRPGPWLGRDRARGTSRAFYGAQYASMAPLFEHHGVQLWTPEVGGRIDCQAEDHEQTMLALGLQSKREIARIRIRVRTAMGDPDPRAGPLPGRPAAVRVPAGRRRAAPEQGARGVGPPGAPAGAGPR
jgi:hypothetical protein